MRIAALRVWLSIVALLLGAGLLAASGLAKPAQRQGGTLRIARPLDVDSVDPAIAYRPDSWIIEFATCAKLYNYPDKPGPAGVIAIPEVATGFPLVSKDGKTQTIRLRRTYRFHTGGRITAANFVAAFNRVASPKLESAASDPPPRDRGCGRRSRRPCADGLRRSRTWPVCPRDPHDAASARPRLPPDHALLLPDRGEHAPPGDQRPARLGPLLRRLARSQPPGRAREEPLLPGTTAGKRRSGRVDVPREEACRVAVERNELDYCAALGSRPRPTQSSPQSTGSTRRTAGSSSLRSSRWSTSPSTTIAPRSRASARSRSSRRSTGRSTAPGSCAQQATTPGSGPTSCCPRRWVATRASTHSET